MLTTLDLIEVQLPNTSHAKRVYAEEVGCAYSRSHIGEAPEALDTTDQAGLRDALAYFAGILRERVALDISY